MRPIITLLLLTSLYACEQGGPVSPSPNEELEAEYKESEPDYQVALKFINDYADILYNGTSIPSEEEWTEGREDVTEEFKAEVKRIIQEGLKNDPEMGLGFDPILDAQDLPSSFEAEREDGEYLVVKGVDWPEFLLTMKLKQIDGQWLVDGSGIVNIPKSRQMKR